ncbi:hypothetical protein [Kribbella sp. CA-294648]|uniref:hypothetical protein n=1 Tax=Kribbella sp. CA-294648 TaxID=3239948 RepID=UPI003D8AEEA4
MPLEDLPDWLPGWSVDHLGAEPVDVLFQLHQVSMVFRLRLAGGTEVVVKARGDDGRAASCVAAQAQLAATLSTSRGSLDEAMWRSAAPALPGPSSSR